MSKSIIAEGKTTTELSDYIKNTKNKNIKIIKKLIITKN